MRIAVYSTKPFDRETLDAANAELKSGQLGALGIDVYEDEAGLFFDDRSNEILQDDTIARLLTFRT